MTFRMISFLILTPCELEQILIQFFGQSCLTLTNNLVLGNLNYFGMTNKANS